MYYSHNLHFIAIVMHSMNGNYAESTKAALELAAHVGPHVKDMPPLEGFMTIPLAVDVRFRQWDKIMSMKAPDPSMKVVGVYWHFARGMALASQGKTAEAEAELKIVRTARPNKLHRMPSLPCR